MNRRARLLVVCGAVLAIACAYWLMRQPSAHFSGQPPEDKPVLVEPTKLPGGSKTVSGPSGLPNAVPAFPVPTEIRPRLADLAMSPAVRTIVGLDKGRTGYKDRRAALQKLNRRVSKDDVKALRAFLAMKSGEEAVLDSRSFNAVKNDVLDILLRQDNVPEAMGSELAGMFRDEEHDNVWRDYCIQYLGPYYDIRWPAGANAGEDVERKDVEAAYWEALKETDKTFAGTALLGIERLSRTRAEIGRTNIADVAVSLATNEACIEANRITAFRVAALMDKKEVLPAARVAAQTGETGPLRMAAIATIGDLGDAADRELLQSFAASSEKRVSTVAESALKSLDARQAGITSRP